MQELQRKQQEQKKMREALGKVAIDPSPEERVARMRANQDKGEDQLFAQQYSTIFNAASDGDLPAVKHFLDARARVKNLPKDLDRVHKGAIHYAAEKGHDHIVTFLLGRKCPVDLPTGEGTTALMFACKMNHLSTIELLIENGANLLLKNAAHMSAMHFVCAHDHRKSMELCLRLYKHMKESIITKATKAGDKAAAKSAKPDSAAAGPSKAEQIKAAMKEAKAAMGGAAQDDDGDDQSASESLGSNGSAVKKMGKRERMREDMIKLSDNIILEMETINEIRPLHIAAIYDARECIEFLLQQGIDVNAPDVDGDTALHKAARCQFHVIYRWLLAAGGNPNTMNRLKETPARLFNWDNTYL